MRTQEYQQNPIAFIDDLVKKTELGKPFRLTDFQRLVLSLAFQFDADGKLLWSVFLWSQIKKSGKTFFNAVLTLWWAITQEAPNELYVVANDFEQSKSRVLKAMGGLIRHNPELKKCCGTPLADRINVDNGSVITAITGSDYAGDAGSNHGWVSVDEPWGIVHEKSVRLMEELTPVPTRLNSVQFLTTYAGFEGQSEFLWNKYLQSVGPEEHPQGQGKKIHPDIPLYLNEDAGILTLWDHERRLPWQDDKYYKSQKRTLRPSAYIRIHENRWVSGTEQFVSAEMYDVCVDPDLSPIIPGSGFEKTIYLGWDGATKRDCTAVVGVCWENEKIRVACHKIWTPKSGEPLDLEKTSEDYILGLRGRLHIGKVLYDPYQLQRSAQTLRNRGLIVEEFPQTPENLTTMGQNLYDLLIGKNVHFYNAPDLREQMLNCVAEETPRGWKIAKAKTTRKIDSIVALAMACLAAVQAGRGIEIDVELNNSLPLTQLAQSGGWGGAGDHSFWQTKNKFDWGGPSGSGGLGDW